MILAHPPYTLLFKRLLSRSTFRVARTEANDVPAIDVSESSLTVKVKSDGRGSTILVVAQTGAQGKKERKKKGEKERAMTSWKRAYAQQLWMIVTAIIEQLHIHLYANTMSALFWFPDSTV